MNSMNSITPLHEKISAVVTANGDTFNAIVHIALNTSEQLFALNMNALRSYKTGIEVPKSGNPLEQLTAQSVSPARSLEFASDYLRNFSGICIKSQVEIGQITVERTNELAESIGALLDSMAKSGPTGSVEAVEQIKSSLNSATEAYERMVNAGAEIAERALAVADDAVQPMIAAASTTEKKAMKKAA
ncbi:MAG TPA: hypothetical protein PL143_05795 [Rhodocyclaceae bacterium]|nr:hypothetical protein [Rhodocyclaceae bacterium]